MNLPKIVSHDERLAARKRLLAKEKEFTRARDRLNAERRGLPMVRIDKDYGFDGPDGKTTLLDLFDGRRQLIVYFHTYSTYARGADLLNSTFNYLDLNALGRQEPWEEPPGRSWLPASGWWWRRHDEYKQEINDCSRSTQ